MGGIGTAICQRLHKEGFKVIAGCGPSRDFQKWLDEQKALGYTFHASVGNVGDWESTVEAFNKTKAEHGNIDVLVNNAGITRDRMFVKMTPDDWQAVIETNLNSMFNVTKQVVGDMVEKIVGTIPVKRLGEPSEIASIIAWLASEEGGYSTGADFSVNGGLHMH
jgi:acetoacetyl-CoA reductase